MPLSRNGSPVYGPRVRPRGCVPSAVSLRGGERADSALGVVYDEERARCWVGIGERVGCVRARAPASRFRLISRFRPLLAGRMHNCVRGERSRETVFPGEFVRKGEEKKIRLPRNETGGEKWFPYAASH